jgi:hypothetical protein
VSGRRGRRSPVTWGGGAPVTSGPGASRLAVIPRLGDAAGRPRGSYDERDRPGSIDGAGDGTVQSTQPRDIGLLVLVVGLFAILLAISLVFGSAPIR